LSWPRMLATPEDDWRPDRNLSHSGQIWGAPLGNLKIGALAVRSATADVLHLIRTTATLLMLAASCATHADQSTNVALGRPYTLDPPPNYSGGTSKTGAVVLTDGSVSHGGTMWLQSSAVGWAHVRPVTITIDLGDVVTIDRVTWH